MVAARVQLDGDAGLPERTVLRDILPTLAVALPVVRNRRAVALGRGAWVAEERERGLPQVVRVA